MGKWRVEGRKQDDKEKEDLVRWKGEGLASSKMMG